MTRLYRLAWSLCGSRRLAEDLTRETCVPRSRRARGDFPHLVCTLRKLLDDHRRSERRRPSPSRADDADFTGAVYTAVADLPEPLRDVVAAVDMAGLSHGEAARSLRIPLETAASRLYRGRSRLAAALGEAD